MTERAIIITALIAAVPPTLMALVAYLQTKKNQVAIQDVHLSLNSRLDQLVKAEKSVSKSEGIKEGRTKRS